jgi:protein O-mannosyl-transferase
VRRWPDGRPTQWLVPFLIALITLVVFLPVLQNGFVDWDDDRAFLQNPHYRGLGVTELGWMWTTIYMGQYRPLTWMTYGADYLLWGLDPRGYHLTNMLLHVVNALLVYWVARWLLGRSRQGVMPGEERVELSVSAGPPPSSLRYIRCEWSRWPG